jgi:hypothetical protein
VQDYEKLFTKLEQLALFGQDAREWLAPLADEYRQLERTEVT